MTALPAGTEREREEVARAMHAAAHHEDIANGARRDPNSTEAWESGGVDTRWWYMLADAALAAVVSPPAIYADHLAGHPADHTRYEPCVTADGRCTRWSHNHEGSS